MSPTPQASLPVQAVGRLLPLVSALSAPQPRQAVCSPVWGCATVQCPGDPCTGHTEAPTDHLVTECSSA